MKRREASVAAAAMLTFLAAHVAAIAQAPADPFAPPPAADPFGAPAPAPPRDPPDPFADPFGTGAKNPDPVWRHGPGPADGNTSTAGPVRRLGGGGLTVSGDVYGIAFSPDGKVFAAATERGGTFVTVWDATTGQPRGTIKTDTAAYGLEFSADGKSLLSGRQRINVETGRTELLTNSYVRAISGDGSLIAAQDAAKNALVVWQTGGAGNLWNGPVADDGRIIAVDFSPDGKLLAATLDDGRVALVEAKTGNRRAELNAMQRGSSTRPVFSPDGKRVALPTGRRSVQVFDSATGELASELPPPPGGRATSLVAFFPDGKLIATAARGDPSDRNVYVWEIESTRLVRKVESAYREITSLTISPDSTRLAVGGKGAPTPRLQVWELDGYTELYLPRGPRSRILHLAFAANSRRLASGSEDGEVHLWDVRRPEPLLELEGDATHDLRFSADGWRLASAGRRGALKVWETDSGDEVFSCGPNQSRLDYLSCLAANHEFAAFTPVGRIEILNFATGEKLSTIVASNLLGELGAVALSPDGKLVAATTGGLRQPEMQLAQIWNVESGETVRGFTAAPGDKRMLLEFALPEVRFSPAGDYLAARGEHGELFVWEIATGARILGFDKSVAQFCFSPYGRNLLVYDGQLKVIELATGKVCFESSPESGDHFSGISALAMSPDGRLAACAVTPENAIRLSSLAPDGVDTTRPPMPGEITWAWSRLLEADAELAYRAAWQLADGGDATVELLRAELQPLIEPQLDEAALEQFIADLDSNQFDVRERAATEILRLGPIALPHLRDALETPLSVEHRFRLARLVLSIERATRRFAGEPLRRLRAIGVLEQIGTRAAGEVLAQIADGAGDARETIDAQAALVRLKARLGGP